MLAPEERLLILEAVINAGVQGAVIAIVVGTIVLFGFEQVDASANTRYVRNSPARVANLEVSRANGKAIGILQGEVSDLRADLAGAHVHVCRYRR